MPQHLVLVEFKNYNITSEIVDFSQFLVCPGQLDLLSSKKIKYVLRVLIVFMEEIKQFDVKTISHGWMIIEYLIHSYSLFSCSIVLQSKESKHAFHVSRCMGELCFVPISE